MSGSLGGLQPDTSMYQRFLPQQQAPVNPMQTLGQFQNLQVQGAQLQGQRLQNQQTQMAIGARTAMGPILQQSVGPDGQIDWNKAVVNMAQHPETAWMAGDVMNQALQRQLTQADVMGKTLANAQTKMGMIGTAVQSLAPLGTNITKGDVAEKLSTAVGQGFPMSDAMAYLQHIAAIPDGAPLLQHVKQMGLIAQGAAKTIDTLSGSLAQVNQGGNTQTYHNVPYTGTATQVDANGPTGNPTPSVNTPDPNTFYKPQPQLDTHGKETTGPLGIAVGMPAPGTVPGWTPGQTPGGPLGQSGAGGTLGQTPTQPGFTRAQPAVPSASVMTKPPTAFATYLDRRGPDVEYEQNLNKSVEQGQTAMQQMQEIANLLPQVRQGGGSEVRAKLAQMAQAVGVDPEKVNAITGGTGEDALGATQAMLKLYLRNAVGALGQDMGGNRKTEKEFETYIDSASPNLDMSPGGVAKIMNFTKMLLEQKVAEQANYQAYQHTDIGDPVIKSAATDPYSQRFMNAPQSWQPYWADLLKHTYANGPLFRDIHSAAQQIMQPGGSP